MIVDSTRRGKSLPDALSKTVPIWCAVLNRASHCRHGSPAAAECASQQLRTPRDVVSPSEHAQIEERINGWVEALLQSDLPIVKLDKPLRPLFVTPGRIDEEVLSSSREEGKDFYPVVLLSASIMVKETPELVALSPTQHREAQQRATLPSKSDVAEDTLKRIKGIDRKFIYVQGSGDDEEAWAEGLTPALFWQPENLEKILSSGGSENCARVMRDIQSNLNAHNRPHQGGQEDCNVKGTPVFLGRRSRGHVFTKAERDRFDMVLFADDSPLPSDDSTVAAAMAGGVQGQEKECQIHRLRLEPGKKGLNHFREALATWLPQFQHYLAKGSGSTLARGILLCSTDADKHADLAASFAIAILARFFDASRELIIPEDKVEMGKDDVRKRMQWVVTDVPWSNPSRSHLLRVNQVLLSPDHRPSTSS